MKACYAHTLPQTRQTEIYALEICNTVVEKLKF